MENQRFAGAKEGKNLIVSVITPKSEQLTLAGIDARIATKQAMIQGIQVDIGALQEKRIAVKEAADAYEAQEKK